jgi:hypothetical protein
MTLNAHKKHILYIYIYICIAKAHSYPSSQLQGLHNTTPTSFK